MPPKKIPASTLTMRVNGSNVVAHVTITKLSTSGKTTFRTVCAEHKVPIQKPTLCPSCNGEPKDTLKGYPYSKPIAFLTSEHIKSLKPKGGDAQVDVVGWLGEGELHVSAGVARLLPETHVLTPWGDETAAYATLFHLLVGGGTAVARMSHKAGNSDAFYTALLVADTTTNTILVLKTNLSRDTKDVPTVALKALPEKLAQAAVTKGAALRQEKLATLETFDFDPFRDAREEAIIAAASGEAPPVVTVEVAPVENEEEKLLALL